MAVTATRQQVLGYRVRAQQLDRASGTVDATSVLDIGVQDTGPDGALWALAIRGVDTKALSADEFAMAWTLRGAPHLYRRADLPAVAVAVRPFSEADAGKRIFDASKPLKAAGIGNLEALDTVAGAMRSMVTEPMVKGDVSGRLAQILGEPYLRYCRRCDATHPYEMPFRLAALFAGLELQPATSPPVMQPSGIEPAAEVPERLDVVRAYLHLLGPATPKQAAGYIDAPVKDVKAQWPADAVEVSVDGETRWMLADDVEALQDADPDVVRLLGPYDLFLQAKDRELLVADAARTKALWPVLGRPGAVLVGGDIAGLWRPRASGKKFRIQVEMWDTALDDAVRAAITSQAERLAEFRGVAFAGIDAA